MYSLICVDSSVWIDHFRGRTTRLQNMLEAESERIVVHEFIILELALGGIPNKENTLSLLGNLTYLPSAPTYEILQMVNTHNLGGKGIGCVDCHILASCLLTDTLLWTHDRQLAQLAKEHKVFFDFEK